MVIMQAERQSQEAKVLDRQSVSQGIRQSGSLESLQFEHEKEYRRKSEQETASQGSGEESESVGVIHDEPLD